MSVDATDTRKDFAADTRLLGSAAAAARIGVLSTVAAYALLQLIRFVTNIFFFHSWSTALNSPAHNIIGLWVIPVPIVGGLIIGLMARFGSEKIRGHGIPEAIDANLVDKSKMSLKIALLKPLSSGIAIGIWRRGSDHHDWRGPGLAVRTIPPHHRWRTQGLIGGWRPLPE
jgi:H+/Cl- antiporter ClcA